MGCHSKVPLEFIYMESGTMKLRHILTLNRMMYHHHILTSDPNETIVKMYHKQQSDPSRYDWYELLIKDFEFIGLTINENEIKAISRLQYKNKIKPLIRKAAFDYFLKEKQRHSK
jgi:hypothetical protein